MKLSRERKVYLVLAGLGVVALTIDRLFLSPSEAAAAPAESLLIAPTHVPTHVPSKSAADFDASGPSFASKIRAVTATIDPGARDPFQPADSWPRPSIRAEAPAAPLTSFEGFLQAHKVTSVYLDQSGKRAPTAYIDGKSHHVGDRLDGYTLSAVDSKGVQFQSPSGEQRRLDIHVPESGARVRTADNADPPGGNLPNPGR